MKKCLIFAIIITLLPVIANAEECTAEKLKSYEPYIDDVIINVERLDNSNTYYVTAKNVKNGIALDHGRMVWDSGPLGYATAGENFVVRVFVSDGGVCAGKTIKEINVDIPDPIEEEYEEGTYVGEENEENNPPTITEKPSTNTEKENTTNNTSNNNNSSVDKEPTNNNSSNNTSVDKNTTNNNSSNTSNNTSNNTSQSEKNDVNNENISNTEKVEDDIIEEQNPNNDIHEDVQDESSSNEVLDTEKDEEQTIINEEEKTNNYNEAIVFAGIAAAFVVSILIYSKIKTRKGVSKL